MTTRGTLQTAVGEFLDRAAPVAASFDTIMLLAEALIARSVRVRVQETQTTLTATSALVALPTDYLAAVALGRLDTDNPRLVVVEPNVLRNSHLPGQGGPVQMAAFEGTNLRLAPPANATAPTDLSLLYIARFPALVVAGDGNWLTINHFDLVFAALMHVAGKRFRDTEIATAYLAEFNMLVDALHVAENASRTGDGPQETFRDLPVGV